MSSQVLSIADFRLAAKAAIDEAVLNALRDREETEQQDRLWLFFDTLEEIATKAQKGQRSQQGDTLQGEVVDEGGASGTRR